jgi:hypothetical protein
LEPVLKKDSVRSPRSTPPRPLLRGKKRLIHFLLNTVVYKEQILPQRLKRTFLFTVVKSCLCRLEYETSTF